MPSVAVTDMARMRDELFFDQPNLGRRLSKFWVLLLLAAVIATAGVMADSTATVIGAMIVAPLMTPILGMVLAMATGNARSLIRCTLLVVAGVAAVVFVGWGFGHLSAVGVVAANNSQVAGRVHPGL